MPDSRISFWQGDSRQIALALGISVAIHALILFLVPGLKEWVRLRAPDSPPLVARLLEVRPAPVSAVARPESPPALRETVRPPERLPVQVLVPESPPTVPRPLPAPIATAPAVTAVAPAVKGPVSRVPQQSEPTSVARSDPASAARSEWIPTPPAPAPVADELDPASVVQYRDAIIAAARRYRKYPRIAIENNWQGRAEVRLAIDANGAIASLTIRTRSGYEVLDRQALEMIRQAKPVAPMPTALRGKGFVVDVPVFFSLKEETG